MKRREFLKSGIVAVASVPLFGLFNNILPAPGAKSEIPLHDNTDIAKLFIAECKMYPMGHVAHSIRNVESVPNPEDFGYLLRGLSVTNNKIKAKYWAVVVDRHKFITDIHFRRKMMDDCMRQLMIGWKSDNIAWGAA